MMVQTGSLLVSNARLFATLGCTAVRVEVLSPDRLRPFAKVALHPMLRVMVLLEACPLTLLGLDGLGATSAIGPVATALLNHLFLRCSRAFPGSRPRRTRKQPGKTNDRGQLRHGIWRSIQTGL